MDPVLLVPRGRPAPPPVNPGLTPDRVFCGFFRSEAFFGIGGFLDLEGRGSLVLAFFRGGPGEAAAAGVVSSSQ